MKNTSFLLVLFLSAATFMSPAFADENSAKDSDASLPPVLIIGDSISIGYTAPTRKALEGVADVRRIPTNGGPTTRGLANIDAWLGKTPWKVIHFNWGLHDLKHVDGKAKLVAIDKGKIQVPLDQYEANLRKLVRRLKKSDAILIWASTTPVPKGATGRIPIDTERYNEVAQKIMMEEGVVVNDLYAFCQPRLAKIQRPANVHFTPAGSALLGKEVARQIKAALQLEPTTASADE